MASGDRTIAFTEEQLEDLSETFETVLGVRKSEPDYWESIPAEILEQILLDVPSYQLPLNKSWVCKNWTNIILQHRFWLNKLKKHGIHIDENVWSVLQEFENNKIVTGLYYASVYQEYHILQTPVPKFLKTIPMNEVGEFGLNKPWTITDKSKEILMASGFLICRSHENITLALKKENIKGLRLLLKLLATRNVPLSLFDHYSFMHFYPRDNYLQMLKGSYKEAKNLKRFIGCLHTFKALPLLIESLILSVSVDEHNICLDPGYANLIKHTDINIAIHLKAGKNISNLPNVTSGRGVCIVSDLKGSHISWLTVVGKKFLNPGHLLGFFNYQLNYEETVRMLHSISHAGIALDYGVFCSSSTLSFLEQERIDNLFISLWGYNNKGFEVFNSDDDLYCHLFIRGFLTHFRT